MSSRETTSPVSESTFCCFNRLPVFRLIRLKLTFFAQGRGRIERNGARLATAFPCQDDNAAPGPLNSRGRLRPRYARSGAIYGKPDDSSIAKTQQRQRANSSDLCIPE